MRDHNDHSVACSCATISCIAGATGGHGFEALLNNASFFLCDLGSAPAAVGGGVAGCLTGVIFCCVYMNRDNLYEFLMARNVQPQDQQDSFKKDMQELHQDLINFKTITGEPEKEKAAKELNKLVNKIIATQNRDNIEMLADLFEKPVETIEKLGIDDKEHKLSPLMASLILTALDMETKKLSPRSENIFKLIMPPQQHEMSSQPQPHTIGVTEDMDLITRIMHPGDEQDRPSTTSPVASSSAVTRHNPARR